MATEKHVFEYRGSKVENAIAAGLAELRLTRNEVIIEVIDPGSRGLLGIGSRDAVVRITKLAPPAPVKETPIVPEPPRLKVEEIKPVEPVEDKTAVAPEILTALPEPEPEPVVEDDSPAVDLDDQLVQERETAVEVISELLERMQVQATVAADLSDVDDKTKRRINIIQVKGEDLGVIIGPRGETLDALQHISRLMVAHRLHRRSRFVVDIQGYRERREMALTRMAERMARKAVQRGSRVGLEAMPANERRIIHMALRSSEEVYTESTGEGSRRRVQIIPKR